jgi:hypothetical protein
MIDPLAALEKVLPPMTRLQTWRVTMALGLMLGMFHIAWACGWVPGLEGFAQSYVVKSIEQRIADFETSNKLTVEQINRKQDNIIVRLIRSDIEEARAQQCIAIKDRNTGAAEGWRARLQVALNEYYSTTGAGYALRGCDEY